MDLRVAKVADLNIKAGGDLTLDTTATIGSAQVLTVDATGSVNLDNGNDEHTAAGTVTLSGSGSKAAVDLGAVGASDLSYATSITASGLTAGLDIGNIDGGTESVTVDLTGMTGTSTLGTVSASKSVSIDANGATKKVTTGSIGTTGNTVKTVVIDATNAIAGIQVGDNSTNIDIFATGSITFNGSNLTANSVDIDTEDTATATTIAFKGGISTDVHDITLGTKATSLTVTGDLGLGTDDVNINLADTTAAGGQTIDITGLVAETVDIVGASDTQAVVIKGSKSTSVADSFDIGTATMTKLTISDIDKVLFDDSSVNASAFSGSSQKMNADTTAKILTLTGTDAADTIDVSSIASVGTAGTIRIEGGKLGDTITLGSDHTDMVFIKSTDTGVDSISGFVAGNSGTQLNVGAFSATHASSAPIWSTASLTATSTNVDIKGKLVKVKGTDSDEASEVAALFASASNATGKYLFLDSAADGSEKAVVLTGEDNSTTVYVWSVVNTATAGIAESEVTQLATITLTTGDIDDLVAADFSFVA